MLKNEFITVLRENLSSLPEEDLERVLDYYSEIIDDCMEDGMTEEEATAEIGSVQEAIANVFSVNPSKISEETIEKNNTAVLNNPSYNGAQFSSILVEERESDVVLIPSANGLTGVEWHEKLPHTAEVINGVLTIRREDKRRLGFFMFGMVNEDAKLRITVPAGKYHELRITTASGDVTIPHMFSFATADVHSASGDIEFMAPVENDLHVKSTSGDVSVEKLTASIAEIGSVSGDVELDRIKTNGGLKVKTVSGDLNVRDSDCGEFTAKTVSGDLKLDVVRCKDCTAESVSGDVSATAVIASSVLRIVSTSGDVKLNGCDGGEVAIRTASGSVRGSLLTGKTFHCTSRSGSISAPAPTPGGKCEVSTISGSIRLNVGN